MNITENNLIDIEIEKQQEEIYQKIRTKKRERTKKELLKEFGGTPLMFITLINSLCVSFLLTYYLVFLSPRDTPVPNYGENTITIMFGFIMSGITLLLFIINIVCYSLNEKSHSLNEKEKTK